MSLFSILKQPRIKSTAASLGVATLGGTQITLTMLEKLMDGMPIPLVKGVAGAGVEVIKIGRAMQENYSGCRDVIDRASSLLAIIIDIVKENDEGDIPEDVKKDIERLTRLVPTHWRTNYALIYYWQCLSTGAGHPQDSGREIKETLPTGRSLSLRQHPKT
ncbi:hypothetical protein FRC03_005999 [Tulasnella sp. 419]|nr:hypothetical protein FRC03_005999 [Tulasnella sp. 419]